MNVAPEHIRAITQTATAASTSGNMQAYSIIVTTDGELKKKLHAPHFYQDMVIEAPVLMTFCADFRRMRRWLTLRQAADNFDNFMSFMIASIDAILASQNAALAAEALGLGICYMGTTLASCDEIATILNCPAGVVPVVGFSLGYPAESPEARERLPLEAIVHDQTYHMADDERLEHFYAAKERSSMARYRQSAEQVKKLEELGIDNLAQIYTQLKYTRASHLQYSQNVLRCLERQGFMNNGPARGEQLQYTFPTPM